MGTVQLSEQQLYQMAQRCEDTRASIAQGMSQLMGEIESLSAGAFRGAASGALVGVSHELNEGLTNVLNALDELAGKMSSASQQFGVRDDDAANTIRAAGAAGGTDSTAAQVLRGA
jgi:WXG100 family type VII secretion target